MTLDPMQSGIFGTSPGAGLEPGEEPHARTHAFMGVPDAGCTVALLVPVGNLGIRTRSSMGYVRGMRWGSGRK